MEFIKETIKIYESKAPLRCYIPDEAPATSYKGKRPAVIVLPGGAYSITYAGEAEPIALKFTGEGICAFVLDYSVKSSGKVFPQALLEALSTVGFVRENAERFGIDPHNIATLGFSAGGHLCSCTGTLWNSSALDFAFGDGTLKGEREHFRPDKMILCYPVISSDPRYAHKGSFANLFGKGYDEISGEELELVSTEKQVSSGTPPTMLWHTAEDTSVSPRNSIAFADALSREKIPFELYIYPHGGHGSCTGDYVTRDLPFGSDMESAEWTDKAVRFLFDTFKKEI